MHENRASAIILWNSIFILFYKWKTEAQGKQISSTAYHSAVKETKFLDHVLCNLTKFTYNIKQTGNDKYYIERTLNEAPVSKKPGVFTLTQSKYTFWMMSGVQLKKSEPNAKCWLTPCLLTTISFSDGNLKNWDFIMSLYLTILLLMKPQQLSSCFHGLILSL